MRKAPIALRPIAAASLLLVASVSLRAQTPQPQETSTANVQQQQMNQIDQMLGPLNLTSDQVRRIREINAELREERQTANFRLRTAQRALTEAIQAPTPDEALIEQRSKEVADAQANTIRLRSLTEARILQVLTQEQRMRLRELRQGALSRGRNQPNPRMLDRRRNALRPKQNTAPMTPRHRRLMPQPRRQRPE